MRFSERLRVPALLCALALLICALVSRPFAETGIIDDWSYIRTAQLLAQTGHIVYNGWATAMLGWQLLLTALFIKLFGFSFSVARMPILLEAAATAFLLQRTFVRAGLQDWNAMLATLTFVLSPLFSPLSVLFMTDVPGILAIVICLYGCLRALQASTSQTSAAWISFAALANAIGGTVRQTSWLGVLVMVPCTLWLLRRQKRVLIAGISSTMAGVAIVFGCLYWFSRQPNIDPEPAAITSINLSMVWILLIQLWRILIAVSFLLLPVMLMFFPALRNAGRRVIAIAAVAFAICFGRGVQVHFLRTMSSWTPPPFFESRGNIISAAGIWESVPIFGQRPEWLTLHGRIVITAIALVALISTASVIYFGDRKQRDPCVSQVISWSTLLTLSLPFLAAYLVLLAPRATSTGLYDRYLLPILLIVLLLITRYYQDYVRERLPVASLMLVLLAAGISVAGTHDLFAMFRSLLVAAEEVQASGVPRTAIDAGWEYNGLTEIDAAGFVVLPNRNLATQKEHHDPPPKPGTCLQTFASVFLHVSPQYSMSFDPNVCGGRSDFAPAIYSSWLPWKKVTIFVVKNPIGSAY